MDRRWQEARGRQEADRWRQLEKAAGRGKRARDRPEAAAFLNLLRPMAGSLTELVY